MSLELPGQMRLQIQCNPGPNVTPVVVNNQGPGTLEILQFGGLSKLEYVATKLAAGYVAGESLPHLFHVVSGEKYGMQAKQRRDAVIAEIVTVARMLLEACAAAQAPQSEPAKPEAEVVRD